MPTTQRPARVLDLLIAIKFEYGPDVAARKRELLTLLGDRPLATVAQVLQLHELLCFWRAYPDDAALLASVERALRRFAARADVRRHRRALVGSGVAGTEIVYRFGRMTASWLARHWGAWLKIDREDMGPDDRLARALILFALPAEVPGLDDAPLPARAWLDRLGGPGLTDAAFLAGRATALPASAWMRDHVYDALEVVCRLKPGPDTPSRTLARFDPSPVVYQQTPLRRQRPDLRVEAITPPLAVHDLDRRDGQRVIDLARGAMVTRQRDLDGFVWADARDVRLVECGDGLQFGVIGVVPERRFLLESVYGFLTLKNGVPIGYALGSGLLQFSEVAYNVFDTFRGGEAAHVYGRLLATVRAMFRSEEFTVPPYQLGDGNQEGLESGAWWFYYKLGFRPRARSARAIAAQEVARIARHAKHRTPVSTLERLVRHPVYLRLRRPATASHAEAFEALRLDRIGLAVTAHVTTRFGVDRERAARVCADETARTLGLGSWRRLPPGERLAWERWAPLVAVLPGVEAWTAAERRELADVIRAKGGVRESDYAARFDAHPKLRAAIVTLSRGQRWTERDWPLVAVTRRDSRREPGRDRWPQARPPSTESRRRPPRMRPE